MSSLATDGVRTVAKRKQPARRPADDGRDRVELRADPAWLARVQRQADRLGVSVSAYIRQATTRQLEADEATDPGK
jgi:hypothetical protein